MSFTQVNNKRTKYKRSGCHVSNNGKYATAEKRRMEEEEGIVECSLCHHRAHYNERGAHTIDSCPRITCDRCLQKGHIATKCNTLERDILCRYCKDIGHHSGTCRIIPCKNQGCDKRGHPSWLCNKRACGNCGFRNHPTSRCWFGSKISCHKCNSFSHSTEGCIRCNICRHWGHRQEKCKDAICSWCDRSNKDPHHHINTCKDVICYVCGAKGHPGHGCEAKSFIKRSNRSSNKVTVLNEENKDLSIREEFPYLCPNTNIAPKKWGAFLSHKTTTKIVVDPWEED